MTTLIGDDVNLVKRISLVGEMSKFLTSGRNSVPIPGFHEKFRGEGGQSTPRGVNRSKLNERAIYRGNTGSIILLNTVSC